jgi:hypothetical protein
MEDVAKLHSLSAAFVQPSDDTPSLAHGGGAGSAAAGGTSKTAAGEVFPCTGVSWSATGSVLFAS